MKTLKIGISLFSLLAIVSFSNAQTASKVKADDRTERMIVKLGLDETKANHAREISVKYKDLVSNSTDQKQKIAYKQEAEEELKKILSSEQFAKYKEILANEKKSSAARAERAKGAQ